MPNDKEAANQALPEVPWQSMRLQNFRSFKDTGWIPFASLTVVFGKNSSGKTTLLRAPLLLRQLTLAQSALGDVPLSGPFVDFGSYRDLVYQGELRRNVQMSFEFDWTGSHSFRPALQRVEPLAILLERTVIDITLHWNVRSSRTQVQEIAFRHSPSDREPTVRLTRMGPGRIKAEAHAIGFRATLTDLPELSLQTLSFIRAGTRERANELADPTLFFFLLLDRLHQTVSALTHIGPLRDMPERAYRLDAVPPEGPSSSMVGIMASDASSAKSAARVLKSLGVARDLEVTKPAPGYIGIMLVDPKTGRRTNLADVGFGISQVLPIIVVLANAAPGSLILIEQPELHLHPETQVRLADALADLTKERRLSLLVESHSEHLLLRLQRRMAMEGLEPNDVLLYIVDSGRVIKSEIDRLGRLDTRKLPAGFFEEDWIEALELAKAGARRASG